MAMDFVTIVKDCQIATSTAFQTNVSYLIATAMASTMSAIFFRVQALTVQVGLLEARKMVRLSGAVCVSTVMARTVPEILARTFETILVKCYGYSYSRPRRILAALTLNILTRILLISKRFCLPQAAVDELTAFRMSVSLLTIVMLTVPAMDAPWIANLSTTRISTACLMSVFKLVRQ